MKFCKNLHRVIDISDPEWAPFWMNYKMLKKLIKETPSIGPFDVEKKREHGTYPEYPSTTLSTKGKKQTCKEEETISNDKAIVEECPLQASTQLHRLIQNESFFQTRAEVVASLSVSKTTASECVHRDSEEGASSSKVQHTVEKMERNPGEVTFFKLVHSELRKVIHFFALTEEEFTIREERIRVGVDIMKKCDRIMVNDRWSAVAKSLYRLYKDLLLLETYAIMTYCSFSKILKKHDKVTGYSTRSAFMANIVAKTNFSSYPNLIKMISRCEDLYEEVSKYLASEGKEYTLHEDERLFINTIHQLNEQVIVNTNEDCCHQDDVSSERREKCKLTSLVSSISRRSPCSSIESEQKTLTSSLKQLVEENENKKAVPVAALDDDTDEDRSISDKRKFLYSLGDESIVVSKRLCTMAFVKI